MLHHTWDNDVTGGPTQFVWSEVYANDAAFMAHISNPPVGEDLAKHAELATHFEVEFFVSVYACGYFPFCLGCVSQPVTGRPESRSS